MRSECRRVFLIIAVLLVVALTLALPGVSAASGGEADQEKDKAVSRVMPAVDLNKIIDSASKYKGVKYLYGVTTTKGFDCSGYVQYVFKQNKVSLPRTADAQFATGQFVCGAKPDFQKLKRGDLVFFSTDAKSKAVNHVGIYSGNKRFWNAELKKGVNEASLEDDYWKKSFAGARRVANESERSKSLLEYILELFE